MLKKDVFRWDTIAQTSFEDLTLRMTRAHVLAMSDFSLPFELETDASNIAIRAILMQQNHPITFFRKNTSIKMCVASTYVKELFAITTAVAKWRHYLLGRTFVIRTDHRSLKHLMDQVIQTPEQHQYLSKLLNTTAYALFRIEEDNEL